MKNLKSWVLYLILIIFILPLTAHSKMYMWTDENGVKHYSNKAPPEGIKNIQKSNEKVFDEEKHQRLMEQKRLEADREKKELKAAEKDILTHQNERTISQKNQIKKNGIDPKTIELERERLKRKKDTVKNWPNSKLAIEDLNRKIKFLESNPEQYFYELSIKLANTVINPYTGERVPKKGGVGSHGNYYIKLDSEEGKYLNTKTDQVFVIE